ncbi:MAG: hypothetical protein WBK99_07365 [Solirubrobacterales bacterium]
MEIVQGPDRALWAVGIAKSPDARWAFGVRIALDSDLRYFRIPNVPAVDIAAGPDGNLWLTGLGAIIRMTPSVTRTEMAAISVVDGYCSAGPFGAVFLSRRFSMAVAATPGGGVAFVAGAADESERPGDFMISPSVGVSTVRASLAESPRIQMLRASRSGARVELRCKGQPGTFCAGSIVASAGRKRIAPARR